MEWVRCIANIEDEVWDGIFVHIGLNTPDLELTVSPPTNVQLQNKAKANAEFRQSIQDSIYKLMSADFGIGTL